MSVTTSYPGLYIQELPLSAHSITPAPTSIAAFVGYTHPFRTQSFKTAVRLFSFSDYETQFGGLYTTGLGSPDVARAVYQFFLNGGSEAYVVGLPTHLLDGFGAALAPLGGPGGLTFGATISTTGGGLVFTALEPCDIVAMTVSATNVRASSPVPGSPLDMFDVVITYGRASRPPRRRRRPAASAPDTVINGISALCVPLRPRPAASVRSSRRRPAPAWPSRYPPASPVPSARRISWPSSTPTARWTRWTIFNMLLVPGVSDNLRDQRGPGLRRAQAAFAIVDSAARRPPRDGSRLNRHTDDGVLPTQPERGALFPLSAVDRSGDAPADPRGAQRLRGRHISSDRHQPGRVEGPRGPGDGGREHHRPDTNGLMNDPQQGVLNLASVNVLRSFPGVGTVVWGARTLVANNDAYAQSKYVPVRRMTLFLEQSLLGSLRWVVFEPNDEPLWLAIRASIEGFLLGLFKQGALQGSTPSQAFQVKCDSTTTTAADQQNGIVNIVVGVRAAQARRVRRHQDRAARRPDRFLRSAPWASHSLSTSTGSIPTRPIASWSISAPHLAGGRGQQGRRPEALVGGHRVQARAATPSSSRASAAPSTSRSRSSAA